MKFPLVTLTSLSCDFKLDGRLSPGKCLKFSPVLTRPFYESNYWSANSPVYFYQLRVSFLDRRPAYFLLSIVVYRRLVYPFHVGLPRKVGTTTPTGEKN